MALVVQGSNLDCLLKRVESRALTVGVVDPGYVALPLAWLFTSQGFKVSDFDIDDAKVPKLMRGESHSRRIPVLTANTPADADAALILPDHDCFDYERIVRQSRLVVDAMNATARLAKGCEKIILG